MGTLLIDVDGTVVDSYPGIREAFIHSMTSVGIPVPEESWLRRIPGPPMVETMRALGQSDSVTAAALACFRQQYDQISWRNSQLFDGWHDALSEWRSQGIRLFTATSKNEHLARLTLEYLGVADLFDFIGGADPTVERETKADVIAYVLATTETSEHSPILMVGDRSHDTEGAAAFGIPTMLVTWGYGNEQEWSHADYHARNMAEAKGIVRDFFN
ncbi:HAD-IA family hydrolase [Corynebacterium diphtheriae]|uniref:HAD-IA family hydrolase n=1 Tax=Corynebacterium diphtheriae TaxID=1717 RepID=UPI00064C67E3|nr:HAD-IA family hydrolase [Corynebacterium diphtheriae]OWN09903.1 phosphoglycolate phosphatase [Corynebacterium belfantii]KLN38738.1 hydrolase [Corynebacterium diphtheriae bv. gravis str. ISS 4060]MBG9262873.1 HAD-IA family hydrolase [Corynebacterium diphtheriae bv. gravis]OWM55212.1 phosphoglycolate phosphatase [Corynebacterium diphtheriae]OWN02541.1 phosphoglycolate phosphatase [Corynebacterium diphtheriae bv. mitis]